MEEERICTTTELMKITGTESQVKTMGCDHDHRSEKVEEVIEKIYEDRLARLKREHPLVTDERCFILSWFPETIPSGFSEEEEDE